MAEQPFDTSLLHRDMGRLEGRLQALESRTARGEEQADKNYRAVDAKLDKIEELIEAFRLQHAQEDGANTQKKSDSKRHWQVVTAASAVIASAVSGIFALITWIIDHHT